MTSRVLDVGNCDMDHSAISDLLMANFDVQIDRAHRFGDAMDAVRRHQYELVLVNRIADQDGSPGIEIIKAIKADSSVATTKVMMITNFPDSQATAQQAGALLGFGKASLQDTATIALLAEHLSRPAT